MNSWRLLCPSSVVMYLNVACSVFGSDYLPGTSSLCQQQFRYPLLVSLGKCLIVLGCNNVTQTDDQNRTSYFVSLQTTIQFPFKEDNTLSFWRSTMHIQTCNGNGNAKVEKVLSGYLIILLIHFLYGRKLCSRALSLFSSPDLVEPWKEFSSVCATY